jgi:hypothetical protein
MGPEGEATVAREPREPAHRAWIAGMAALIEANTGGWPVSSSPQVQAARQADADVGREQALALGALD